MQWVKGMCLFAVSFGLVFCAACYVHAEEFVSFASSPLWLDATHVTEGKTVRVSTVVMKKDAESARGTVAFFSDGTEIGTADFSLSSSVGGAVVTVTFVPPTGSHAISAKISNVTVARSGTEQTIENAEEIKSAEPLKVDPDNDRDGIADADDPDDDNDGTSDVDEKKNGTDPLKRPETKPSPSVAGASTTTVNGYVGQATDIAKSTGVSVFQTTEDLRAKGKDYFDAKVADGSNVHGFASTTNTDLLKNPKGSVMGIWEMVKAYFFKGAAFVFGNVYAFYIVLIVFILWLLRRIWRRYSLD